MCVCVCVCLCASSVSVRLCSMRYPFVMRCARASPSCQISLIHWALAGCASQLALRVNGQWHDCDMIRFNSWCWWWFSSVRTWFGVDLKKDFICFNVLLWSLSPFFVYLILCAVLCACFLLLFYLSNKSFLFHKRLDLTDPDNIFKLAGKVYFHVLYSRNGVM